MFVQDSNLKGNIAEAVVAAEATKLGIEVLKPQTEHARYDLAFDLGTIVRVQCKWACKRGETVLVRLSTSRHTPLNGYVKTTYSAAEIDAVAAYCQEIEQCYLIPIDVVEGRSQIHLRLSAALNNQEAAVNYAAAYEFEGAVAQLARASPWHGEGHRFESGQLHPDNISRRVGAEEFGQFTGRFLQEAAAGHEFLVTRRGKPMARVLPPITATLPTDTSPQPSSRKLGAPPSPAEERP